MKQLEEFPKYYASSDGTIYSKQSGELKPLKPVLQSNGYVHVKLRENGKERQLGVHQIIGMPFVENPNNKPQINHKNGIRVDNRAENLEWTTQAENVRHAYDLGLRTINDEHKQRAAQLGKDKRKLNADEVAAIRSKYTGKRGQIMSLSRKFNINHKSIRQIINRQSYKEFQNV